MTIWEKKFYENPYLSNVNNLCSVMISSIVPLYDDAVSLYADSVSVRVDSSIYL